MPLITYGPAAVIKHAVKDGAVYAVANSMPLITYGPAALHLAVLKHAVKDGAVTGDGILAHLLRKVFLVVGSHLGFLTKKESCRGSSVVVNKRRKLSVENKKRKRERGCQQRQHMMMNKRMCMPPG